MAEQEGYLEFIESFNHIHKYLKKYTNSDDNVPFSDLIYKAKGHPMINLYLDELHLFCLLYTSDAADEPRHV